MNPLGHLIRAEFRSLSRNSLAMGLCVCLLLLLCLATWLGAQRINTLAAESAAAASADRKIWITQGEDNPHAAAHFSRYAFKPVPALALFDPGVLDTAGAAIWMEGHYQNPAQFRRIEDAEGSALARQMSPARVLTVFGALVIIIFLSGSVAGEREDGTLRQVFVTGLRPLPLAAGKLSASLGLAAALLISALLAIALLGSLVRAVPAPDTLLRIAGLLLVYALFFLIVAGITLGVSARVGDRRAALGVLVGLWAAAILIGPLIASETALGASPNPDGPTTHRRIIDAGNAYFYDDAAREALLNEALERHGVDSRADLPFRYDGYELQHSEEIAHPHFEAIYAELRAGHARQERVLDLASLILPNLAVGKLSAGLSGTDRLHHDAFADAAEAHRRHIVKQLNDDLTYGGDPGADGPYLAGRELWETIPDFDMAPIRASQFAGHYLPSLGILVLQAVLALWFALSGIGGAVRSVRA